jgi:tRNA-dihydrouridine synthase B
VKKLLCDHLLDHYHLYGEFAGVRTARKHIGWYVRSLPGGQAFRDEMNILETCEVQHAAVTQFFDDLAEHYERLPKVIETVQDQLDEVLS